MNAIRRKTVDATQGVIWKQLMALFFPLWLGTMFQQLYNTVDSVVVGRFVGKTALAAVGCTGTVISLTVGIFTGIASGAVVIIAQQYGARQGERVRPGVHTAMVLGVLMGIFFMVVGYFTAPWILRAIGTTADTMAEAELYLKVYSLGMVPNVVYNMGTGVLRAVGDSRRPLYFLVAASICNIVLDLVFVLEFHMGVLGVAVATILSQLLSAVLVVLSLLRAQGEMYQLHPACLCMERQSLKGILRMGIPAALQSVMYSLSNLVIQAAINDFGTDTVAAWTAYGKLDVVFWMTISSMGLAITTFAGQNYGAGRVDRLKKGVRTSIWICAVVAVAMSTLLILFARPITGIFTTDGAVVDICVDMVRFLTPTYITYILIELLSGAIRGAGKVLAPTLISLFGVCALRLLWLLVAVPLHSTVYMVELSYPITWTVTSAALAIYYWKGRWLEQR